MMIISWTLVIYNVFISLITFFRIFTDKTTSGRGANFISCTGAILACIISIYVLRL